MGRNDRVPIVHHGRPALDLEYETMNSRALALLATLKVRTDSSKRAHVPSGVITPVGGDRLIPNSAAARGSPGSCNPGGRVPFRRQICTEVRTLAFQVFIHRAHKKGYCTSS